MIWYLLYLYIVTPTIKGIVHDSDALQVTTKFCVASVQHVHSDLFLCSPGSLNAKTKSDKDQLIIASAPTNVSSSTLKSHEHECKTQKREMFTLISSLI